MNRRALIASSLFITVLLAGCNVGAPAEPQPSSTPSPQAEQQTRASISVVDDAP